MTAVFRLKKNPACSPDSRPMNTFRSINIAGVQKHFQYDRFKTKLKFIKSDSFKFI